MNENTGRASRVLSICLLSLAATAASAGDVEVSLNGLDIRIDDRTGSITGLSSRHTGMVSSAEPASAGLLDVAYPVESFAAMRLATRFSRARVVREPDKVTIRWDALGASRPNLPLPSGAVRAQVVIQAAADGRSVIFSAEVQNDSGASIRQVLFPDVWGLKPFAGIADTRLRLARGVVTPFNEPLKAPGTAPFYPTADSPLAWKQYPAGELTMERLNTLRWLDFGGGRGGLSMFQRKWGTRDWPGILTHRTESDPMSLRLVWEHTQEIAPGKRWSSGEFWLTPHAGGWAKGIEVYRDYVQQVSPPHAVPRHVRDDLGFQTIWMIQSVEVEPGKAAFRFSDLARVAQDAKRYGFHELVPWGWNTYSTLPIPVRPELGSDQDLIDSVTKARDMGVNIAPFISVSIVRNRYAARYGREPSNNDWTYHKELVPVLRPYYTDFWNGVEIDSNNKLWQQDVLHTLTHWIDRGVTSFCWDTFKVDPNKAGGPPPLLWMVDTIRARARSQYPQATFCGESNTHLEIDGPALDYLWIWNDYKDAAPITNVLKTPRMNCNVEDSALVVGKCFADNLYINAMPRKPDEPNGTALISDNPQLAAALLRASALRKQFLPFFVDGTLVGDSILEEPAAAFVRAYQLGSRLLVIVLNDRSKAAPIRLKSDLSLWLPAATTYHVTAYDGRGAKGRTWDTQPRSLLDTRALEPNDFAFFEIAAPRAVDARAALPKDHVHFNAAGDEFLAQRVAQSIQAAIDRAPQKRSAVDTPRYSAR
jgi:hypothetical protein